MVRSTRTAAIVVWCFTVFTSVKSNDFPKCPAPVKAKDTFTQTKFAGEWYLHSAYNSDPNQYTMWPTSCGKLQFSMKKGMSGEPVTEILHANVTNGNYHIIKDFRKIKLMGQKLTDDASFTYQSYEYQNSQRKGEKGQFVILDTDYNCWAVIYECVFDFDSEYVGLLLRAFAENCWNEDTRNKFNSLLQSVHVSYDDVTPIEYNDCRYPPVSTMPRSRPSAKHWL